jgi:hypothetical protein
MAWLLICPHCRDRILRSASRCPACGGDLRDLPQEDRGYIFGEPEEVLAPPAAMEVVSPAAIAVEAESDEGFWEPGGTDSEFPENQEVSLCEALDRILNKGAVLYGEVMLSVADIDLVYLGLQVILASIETARGFRPTQTVGSKFVEERAP